MSTIEKPGRTEGAQDKRRRSVLALGAGLVFGIALAKLLEWKTVERLAAR